MTDTEEGAQLSPVASEKSLTQEQVNEIVGREKARAADRARQELESRHREELERVRAESGKAGSVDAEQIKKDVYDKFMSELQKHREDVERENHERELKNVADQYYLKMGKGSQLFDDFQDVMGDFEPAQFPNAVMLAAGMENTPEIMYELANNPSKLQEIDSLAQKSPKLAMKQLERLSQSINKNLEAKTNNVSAPAPLSRIKSSSVGADSGKMTLKDFKTAPWLRG